MSELTLDETAGPISNDQYIRCARGQGKCRRPQIVQLTTSSICNHTWLMPSLLNVMTPPTLHTQIHKDKLRALLIMLLVLIEGSPRL